VLLAGTSPGRLPGATWTHFEGVTKPPFGFHHSGNYATETRFCDRLFFGTGKQIVYKFLGLSNQSYRAILACRCPDGGQGIATVNSGCLPNAGSDACCDSACGYWAASCVPRSDVCASSATWHLRSAAIQVRLGASAEKHNSRYPARDRRYIDVMTFATAVKARVPGFWCLLRLPVRTILRGLSNAR